MNPRTKKPRETPFKILTSDILITDKIISVDDNPAHKDALEQLMNDYGMQPDDKMAFKTKEDFLAFKARIDAMEGLKMDSHPGGSSANVVTTINKLLGSKRSEATFVGVVGHTDDDEAIRQSLKDARVTLIEPKCPEGVEPESATSYVIKVNGKRSIITYPGNAKQIFTHEIASDDLVKQSDGVLVQGSLWDKLNPEVVDDLMNKRRAHKKEVFLCLPTHADFGQKEAGRFQWIIPDANLILANDDELAITFKTMTAAEKKTWTDQLKKDQPDYIRIDASKKLEDARKKARYDLQKELADSSSVRDVSPDFEDPLGFITRGERGISIIAKDSLHNMPAIEIDKITNNLGAGDTCFAGIIAGHIQGLHKRECADLGNYLAAAKLQENGARLDDPRAALETIAPHVAAKLFADEKVRSIP